MPVARRARAYYPAAVPPSGSLLKLLAREDFAADELGCGTPTGVCHVPHGAVMLPGHFLVVALEPLKAGQYGRFKKIPPRPIANV